MEMSIQEKRQKFNEKIDQGQFIRVAGASLPLFAKIIERLVHEDPDRQDTAAYNAILLSSFGVSAMYGLPDLELSLTLQKQKDLVQDLMRIGSLPIIVDINSGGVGYELEVTFREFDSMGVAAIVINDLQHPKLEDSSGNYILEEARIVATKIKRGLSVLAHNSSLRVFAQVQSFRAGQDATDAIQRAKKYIEAGVHGIIINSRAESAQEVYNFSREYECLFRDQHQQELQKRRVPLFCNQVTFSSVTCERLYSNGIAGVFYPTLDVRLCVPTIRSNHQLILDTDSLYSAQKSAISPSKLAETVGYYTALESNVHWKV